MSLTRSASEICGCSIELVSIMSDAAKSSFLLKISMLVFYPGRDSHDDTVTVLQPRMPEPCFQVKSRESECPRWHFLLLGLSFVASIFCERRGEGSSCKKWQKDTSPSTALTLIHHGTQNILTPEIYRNVWGHRFPPLMLRELPEFCWVVWVVLSCVSCVKFCEWFLVSM